MRKLQILRKICGKTQKEIADYLGVDRSTYAKYESGDSEPTLDTLKKLAKYFDVTTDYLLDRENNKSSAALELKDVYFNFAKRAQDSGLDPEDIEMILSLVERMKKKKTDDQRGSI